MFYIAVSLLRLFSLIVFSGFDQKCVILDKASILNCTQEFLVPRPERWVLVWMVTSLISSLFVIIILWLNQKQLNYSFVSLKVLRKKGSFWSLNVFFVITIVYYGIRFDHENGMTKAMSILLLLRLPVTLLVVYCLNYLPRVRFPSRDNRNLNAVGNVVGCWFTLIVYFAEHFCFVVSVMLDAVLKVAPLIEGNFHEIATHEMHGFVLILLGINVAFQTRLLVFFWYKIFHGNSDLFFEPRRKLSIGNNTAAEQAEIELEGVSTGNVLSEADVLQEETPLLERVSTENVLSEAEVLLEETPLLEGVSTEKILPEAEVLQEEAPPEKITSA